jgi:tape measure domain-containing protein
MANFDINLVIKDGQAVGQIRQVKNELDQTEKKAISVRSVMTGLFASFGTAFAVRELYNIADASVTIDNRLKLVTNSTDELNNSFDRLREISSRTRSPLEENVALFQKVSQAQNELGASNEELFTFVEAVGTALAIQGGSAQTARGALIQLSQSIGATIVRAEEFNSILEGALPLAQAAARGIDEAGGSVARLRALVVDGQITSKAFFDAIISQEQELADLFAKTNPTIAQSFTVLRNEAITTFREFDQATGATTTLANAMLLIAENIGVIIEALAALAVGFAVFKGAAIISSILGVVKTMVALEFALGATTTAAALTSIGLKGLQAASLAFLATPVGVFLAAIAVALTGVYFAYKQAEQATYDAAEGTKTLNEALVTLSRDGSRSAGESALRIAEANREMAFTARDAAEANLELYNTSFQGPIDLILGLVGVNPYEEAEAGAKRYAEETRNNAALTIEENKRVFQAIVANAEAQEKQLAILRQIPPELAKQQEYYGAYRRESEAQLVLANELLTKYRQQAEIQAAVVKYGTDSFQAVRLRNQAEIASLRTQLEILDVAESVKNEIIKAAQAGQKFGSINMRSAIDAATAAADALTAALARALAKASAIGSLIPGLQGAAAGLGAVGNLISKGREALSGINIPTVDFAKIADDLKDKADAGGGGGGGGAQQTFEDLYGAMEKNIVALGKLGQEYDIYNKQQEIAGALNRDLTESEAALVAEAYKRIEVLEKAQEIYNMFDESTRDYITTQAALNELLKQGAINQTEFAQALAETQLVQDLASVDSSLGGQFGYEVQLQEVYDYTAERTNILNQAREVDLINEQEYQARLRELTAATNRELINVELDRWDFAISSAKGSFDTLLGFAEQYAGKQSGLYKGLFIAQKAFAIAEATVNTARAVTNALAAPFPPPIPQTLATAAAIAGGAQIAAIVATAITGMKDGGRVIGRGGPRDDAAGLYALSNGEYVVNAAAASQNLPLLEAMNRGIKIRGMLADGGMIQNASREGLLMNAGAQEADAAARTAPQKPEGQAAGPTIPVNIINVSSREQALAAIASTGGRDIIFNMIEEERGVMRSILGLEN